MQLPKRKQGTSSSVIQVPDWEENASSLLHPPSSSFSLHGTQEELEAEGVDGFLQVTALLNGRADYGAGLETGY